ncbi:hypothetical protein [Persicobacter sp. CCB-QB2]|uniref:hypothetical protein n=1 Tax=Persicobacter sp. CCB-QB2 TaxID=1561025 RepID=UPI0006A9CEB2|nr:hypothetical protein [Persicobacter sp. CCB-QB2]
MIGVFTFLIAAFAFLISIVGGIALTFVSRLIFRKTNYPKSVRRKWWITGFFLVGVSWLLSIGKITAAYPTGAPNEESYELFFSATAMMAALPGIAIAGGGLMVILLVLKKKPKNKVQGQH